MRTFLAFLLFCIVPGTAHAQDAGLYAAEAPEGSAFVRFVNAGDVPIEVSANNKSYGDVTSLESSPYYVFPEGDVSFSLADNQMSKSVAAGNYYTVINKDVIKDTANADRTKATLAVYNAQDAGALSLKAKAGTVSVLENVAARQTAARDINPVKIDLSVEQDGG